MSKEVLPIKPPQSELDGSVTSLVQNQTTLSTTITNELPSKEAVDKMHFKAVARQKFDAVLKHEINNRRVNDMIYCGQRTEENISQYYRIENSKIFSIQDVANETNFIKSKVFSNIMTAPAKATTTTTMVNIGHKLSNSNNESMKVPSVSKFNREADGHVFIYEPLLISSGTLDYVGVKKNSVNSSSNKQDNVIENKARSQCSKPHPESFFRCLLCPYFHIKEMMIACHWIQTHLSQNVYICPHCHGEFLTNYLATKHIMEAHDNVSIEIQIKKSNQFPVTVSFDHNNSLVLPKLTSTQHDGKDKNCTANINVRCHKCNLECKSIADLEDHHKHVHIRYRPFSCGLCNSRVCFATTMDLEHHMKITHPNSHSQAIATSSQLLVPSNDGNVVQVCIDWSQTYISSDKGKSLKCRWCDFQTTNNKDISKHAVKVHHWSKFIKCPRCNDSHEMKDEHYEHGRMFCSSCFTQINILHDVKANNVPSTSLVYRCNPCNYATTSKGSICRHLKYNHARCRAFCCPYCTYAAVERPKIRSHIISIHPGKEVNTIEEVERSAAFKRNISVLFRRFITTEKVEFLKNASSGVVQVIENGQNCDASQNMFLDDQGSDIYKMDLEADSNLPLCHQEDGSKSDIRKRNGTTIPFGEHFKCISCNYRCPDRSCMSRHVKYKHLTSRAHQCPHCSYTNVEKTKVRHHVSQHHSKLKVDVKTNKNLLGQMSLEAKKFYVKVDANRKEMSECVNVMDIGHPSVTWNHSITGNTSEFALKVKTELSKSDVNSEEFKKADEINDDFRDGQFQDMDCFDGSTNRSLRANPPDAISDNLETFSDLGDNFSEEDMIDLNDDFMEFSDDNASSMGQNHQNSKNHGILKISFDNFVIDPKVLSDPKISSMVPVIYVNDVVKPEDDIETLMMLV